MDSFEAERSLLSDILTEEALNDMIKTTSCLATLNSLLQIKHRRIMEGQCEKLCFSIDSIYLRHSVNVDLKIQVLQTALHVVTNTGTHLLQAINYFLDKLQCNLNEDELYETLNLFNVIINCCKNNNIEPILCKVDYRRIYDVILLLLKYANTSKRVNTFTLLYFIPSCLDISTQGNQNILLENIFELVAELKKLEILCVLHDRFISTELNEDCFNLIKSDDYWLLLDACMVSKDSYLQKQAVYLLSKSVDISLNCNNSHYIPIFFKFNNVNEAEKIWKNFFILMDVSNEKQVHIVEPSLHMLNSVTHLHPLWRMCLYKVFLNHPQNSIVYAVALFILQNELEWVNFSKIIKELFSSINKNDYSANFKKIFQEIGNFCTKLNQNEFEFLVEESLKLSWTPAAVWCLYNNIFDKTTHFHISVALLEGVIKRLKSVPHTYIRDGCTKIALMYYTDNFIFDSVDNLLKVSVLFLNADESVFNSFIVDNKEQILFYTVDLQNEFSKLLKNESSNSQYIEILVKILETSPKKMQVVPYFEKYSYKTDLINVLLFENVNNTDLENYVISRMESLEDDEDIKAFLLLNQKFSTPKITRQARDILLETDVNKYSNIHKVIAFGIMNANYNEDCRTIVDLWKNRFVAFTGKTDEGITQFFVELYYKSLNDVLIDMEVIEESVAILTNVLDFQSQAATAIFENISIFLKYANNSLVLEFIDRCFKEFLNFNSKRTANAFLAQIFEAYLTGNDKLCDRIIDFCQTHCNTIAHILSEKIAILSEKNPQKASMFIPLIVKLILNGIVINKNDRVEYFICQDIERRLASAQNNPNLEDMSVRLWALEAMLNLIINQADAANKFMSLLMDEYMKYFNKRYFPDSQIHLYKLRIMQALLLFHNYLKSEKSKLINMIIESFSLESHQPSVRHLMQWLLICLLREDGEFSLKFIADKLKLVNNLRPAAVAGLIPVLYHLCLYQKEMYWSQVVDVFLPCTMGPQFKLRIYSQVALVKLYEQAAEKKYNRFFNDYRFLYMSLKQVIEASGSALYDVVNVNQEFLDYFSLENCDCSTIYYTVPKKTGVSVTEWENLYSCSFSGRLKHLDFNPIKSHEGPIVEICDSTPREYSENIQKKITPWKDTLDDAAITDQTNNFLLVTSLIEKPANLGGLSRTCEVFGIKQLVMKTSKITADKEFKSLSMSSENWVDIMEVKVEDLRNFILEIKRKGYSVIGAEQTAESVKLEEFKFPKSTVLILGNEKEGIPANLIPLLDSCIEIPQFGVVRSLNVHVAGAIVIWEYCKQHR
ncbi:uncharacterized protein BDFB_000226, partial [Asbolus verrucosus]